ncbi:MAG: L-2-amino-thiazoline-4-carboxylic acid hydrolase [Candidatus Brocadiia bacterium]
MSDEDLRRRLRDAYKHRALLYYHIYDELRQEGGEQKAKAILQRAIARRGRELGAKFAPYAPGDMAGLERAFVHASPVHQWLFEPVVERCDAGGLDVQHRRCPLKEAWQEAGLGDRTVATLCEIAAAVDAGTFEAAGFAFHCDTWTPGGDGCCHLHIRPGKGEET